MANNNFTQTEIAILNEFVEVNNAAKKLDDRKKDLSVQVKAIMEMAGVTSLAHNGASLTVSESTRCTVNKATKDLFIAQLNTMGKGSLLTIEVDINKESLEAEMQSGGIDPAFVKKYVSFANVKTLRCS